MLGVGLGLSASACDCGDGGDLGRVVALIRVDPAEIDFGEVPDGATKFVALSIENVGQARLTISALETADPFGVDAKDLVIEPGVRTSVDVWFRAREEAAELGVLIIRSNAFENEVVEVPLRGKTVPGFLDIQPGQVDFTDTVVGTVRSVELLLQNRGIASVGGELATEGFGRPEHFALTGLPSFNATAPLGVAARSETILEFEYRPLDIGVDNGRVLFSFCGLRCGVFVDVVASGVQAILRIEPAAVDFGAVGLGLSKTAQVILTNTGERNLQVSALQIEGTGEVVARPARTLAEPLVPGAPLPVVLEYSPTVAAALHGELVVRSDAPGIPEARIPLSGRGEGPLFSVAPEVLAFGVLRDLGTARRSLLLLNSGSAGVSIESMELVGDPAFALIDVPPLPSRLEGGESLVPAVSFTPTGVGEYAAELRIHSTDPNHALVTVPVLGAYAERLCELDVGPARLNFGLLPLNYERNLTARIQNVGNTDCDLRQGAFATPVDTQFSLTSSAAQFPRSLSPGQGLSLEFRYRPVSTTDAKGTFALTTGDEVYPDRLISLVGSARIYDDLLVLPRFIDFGARKIGCSPTSRPVTVINSGTVDQTVDRTGIEPVPTDFSHTAQSPSRVPAGGSRAFEARYEPGGVGTDLGLLEISIAGKPYPFVVPLTGEGRINAGRTDTFQQVASRKVDVLFVLDDSCSMGDEQVALAMNFGDFIRTASIRNVDFQIGITTTTVENADAGKFVGPILDSGTSSIERQFGAQVNVGITGSGREQGLEAMLSAFVLAERAIGDNRGFLRGLDGAVLVVIFVSDEDDQSPASVLSYYRALLDRAPAGYLAAAVTGGMNGCVTSMVGGASPAFRYQEFLALTSGYDTSICSSNWAQTLSNLGNAAFGLRRRFNLSEPADSAQPITVRVDGVVVPQNQYSYDPAAQAITFVDGNAPPEGAVIQVDYFADCI